ncbi:isocitrate/isopropylmalate dehydrogenase family protein [Deinococcus metallilatus]|uniref:Isocitrate/isopropylmalate dehydrogenase family protein n=1 Tax=Deinococcus metallilatus TaxID=1211322 RepID=A0AAJ5F9H4_9DEIO|nr:isocitrate/isopropylmalate dehydrogenase family protein [Deinococcus metallilatus]MBB5294954.1 tartrate dehydrogenase/decarboxylase/D-malate dehydrogenase [Deinococcus metallilatus]QBY09348.1 isocitrate/isopropylmalate dehydrogenase family protein [Deinococcus metallilatus]RXJ09353.1 isocitrate/isopropylmalate dehydrogenase family protein [Deinococcus metallilatus]TLK28875.1 isocitrate/isopropylmalate dehydrogenase family protein [Deinococcus metallilatus]GMA16885.1 tartrate dehydrogenase [
MNTYRIAVIPGDGIGPEVVAEGLRVLRAVGGADAGFSLELEELPWGSAYYDRHGRMMPGDAIPTLRTFDSIYFGAVGRPDLPDDLTVWGLILPMRRELDLYVNLRPVRLYPGVPTPLRPEVGEPHFTFVRENTEGEYAGLGGRQGQGEYELAVQTGVFTRRGIQRVVEYAFSLAAPGSLVTSVTKSNALRHAFPLWDEVAAEVAARHPDVRFEKMHVDAVAYQLVKNPARFGVLVGSNLFGDILTDLGAGLQGSLGLAASANLCPGQRLALFEPVHGSAPDIAGQGKANPLGAVACAALMLAHLGEREAAGRIERAMEDVTRQQVFTPDLGGSCSTHEVGDALLAALEREPSQAR